MTSELVYTKLVNLRKGEDNMSILKDLSLIISLLIGVPLGIKLLKWIRSNFIFWGDPVRLISLGLGCILLPAGTIYFMLNGVLSSVEYNVNEITKPKYVKYIDEAKDSDDIKDKMEYIKKSLQEEYNSSAVSYCKIALIDYLYYGNEDYEKYLEIVKPILKKEDLQAILDDLPIDNSEYDNIENTDEVVAGESIQENDVQDVQSKKEEYMQKLNSIEDEVNILSYDGSTLEMKETSSNVLKKWDDALNEIYSVLKSQLSSSEMESLKGEQREWIVTRDAGAEESASEFEGGTMYDLEYTEALGRITKERCYELVEVYMK